jgi:hypothetical protein
MDIHKILALLHAERRRVNEVILSLERLYGIKGKKNVPTALGLLGTESGKRKRTVSPGTRAKAGKSEKPSVKKGAPAKSDGKVFGAANGI